MSTEYEKNFMIEIVTEESNSVYARCFWYVNKHPKDIFAKKLFAQLEDISRMDLFKMSIEEIKNIRIYWRQMNKVVANLDRKEIKE